MDYKTLYFGGSGEIVEKKSRFIASAIPAADEAEALAFIEKIRKQYWDARHNCYAYIIGTRQPVVRCSDDGEPAQTAGKPMLDVLSGMQLTNVVVVVTRYFGGTLLGTGGLVRAYSKAVQEGIAHSTVIEKRKCRRLMIQTDYTGVGKLQYLMAKEGIFTMDTAYEADVRMTLLVPEGAVKLFMEKVIEASSGRAVITDEGSCFGAEVGGEIKVFDR